MDAFYLRALRSGRFSLRLDDGVGFLSDRSSDGAVVSRQVEPWVDVGGLWSLYYVDTHFQHRLGFEPVPLT